MYRKKHLLVGAHRADPVTYELAKKVASELAEHLPKSRSRVARAPTAGRLASLIGTDQLDVAVLSEADATGMLGGSGRFEPYGEIKLKLLARLETRILVAHERFPLRHAWLVTAALDRAKTSQKASVDPVAKIEWHPGSRVYNEGKPLPSSD
ncbi:MAG: hypothetical protein GY948_19810 [Alphaproteobacteria bacterium]|nr:hypothetical protein [Alphaproteobacteria bacterium]